MICLGVFQVDKKKRVTTGPLSLSLIIIITSMFWSHFCYPSAFYFAKCNKVYCASSLCISLNFSDLYYTNWWLCMLSFSIIYSFWKSLSLCFIFTYDKGRSGNNNIIYSFHPKIVIFLFFFSGIKKLGNFIIFGTKLFIDRLVQFSTQE